MPSQTESVIASQAIGKINEVTPPEYSTAYTSMESTNFKFSYARPDQNMYQGKTVTDSIMKDIKYNADKAKEVYFMKSPKANITPGLRAKDAEYKALHQASMLGFYK